MMKKDHVISNWITSAIKWAAAFSVLYVLFRRMDTDKIIEALKYAKIELYLPLAILFVILWFLIESQNLMFLFNMFGHDISFSEMRMIRGASYMLMIINYNLGLGAIAWYLRKQNAIPIIRASSVMFFYYFVESVGITFFAMAGCFLIIRDDPTVYVKIVVTAGLMFISYIGLFFLFLLMPEWGFLKKIRQSPVMQAFHEATFKGYFTLSAYRSIYFGTFILFFHFGLKCFNVTVPFYTLIGLVPVIFFIGNLPVTPFGIGTIQAAMMFFFRKFGPYENILSFSIIYSTTLLFMRAPIGLIYLKKSHTKIDDIRQMGRGLG